MHGSSQKSAGAGADSARDLISALGKLGQLLNEAADLVMSGIAVLLTDIVRGLCAYGVPIAASLVRAYTVCFLAKRFMARCGFNPEGNVEAKSSLQAAF
eukprot:7092748-Alexandrium_andersonii.AAC.1